MFKKNVFPLMTISSVMETSSPTAISGDQSLPRRTMEIVRIEEKYAYIEQLKGEIKRTRARIDSMSGQVKQKLSS